MNLRLFLVVTAAAFAFVAISVTSDPQTALICLAASILLMAALIEQLRIPLLLILVYIASSSTDQIRSFDIFAGNFSTVHYIRFGVLLCVGLFIAPYALSIIERIVQSNSTMLNFLCLYIVFCFASTVWSEIPLVTLAKASELLIGFVVVCSALSETSTKRRLYLLFMATIWFMVFSNEVALIGYFVDKSANSEYNQLTQQYSLAGGFLPVGSNSISRYGSIISLVSLTLLLKVNNPHTGNDNKLVLTIIFAFGIVCEFMTVGRTGIAAFALSCLILSRGRIFLAALVIPSAAMLIIYYNETILEILLRGQGSNEIYSLSGRADWWQVAVKGMQDSPFLGFGFGVGTRVCAAKI